MKQLQPSYTKPCLWTVHFNLLKSAGQQEFCSGCMHKVDIAIHTAVSTSVLVMIIKGLHNTKNSKGNVSSGSEVTYHLLEPKILGARAGTR